MNNEAKVRILEEVVNKVKEAKALLVNHGMEMEFSYINCDLEEIIWSLEGHLEKDENGLS